MITYRELSIKNRPGYIFDSMTNIKGLDTNLVSINQISFMNDNAGNYETEYSKDCNNVYPLYLVFNDVDVYFSCVDGEKYLVFAPTGRNEELLENYKEEIRSIKERIEPFEYDKDYMETGFDPALFKLDKKSSIGANIYYIDYITRTSEYNINSVNPLYLVIAELDRFIEKKNGSKYLSTALTGSNNEVLKKHAEGWKGIKAQVLKINGSVGDYDKDYMKIKFDSDDDLPLGIVLKFRIFKRCS